MLKLWGFWVAVVSIGLTISACPALGQGKGPASISGKITLAGKPAKGVPVLASIRTDFSGQKPPAATATSDEDGRYRIVGLAAGQYSVVPYQPANVLPDHTNWDPGAKSVTVADGEAANDVDFTLSAGGVITGRIVGQDGRVLIEQRVNVESADGKSKLESMSSPMYQTDDRGVYRIYGVPAGRYIVSVGEDSHSGIVYGPSNASYVQKTFYPGGTERSQAQILELSDGLVESGIDITVGPREKTYTVSGRMIDQATGKPVGDVPVAYGLLSPDEQRIGAYGSSSSSDALGQFKLSSLRPGRYTIFAGDSYSSSTKWMSDPTVVEIVDSDISDIEIKLRTGATIDGVAVIEGPAEAETLKKFAQLKIQVFSWPSDTSQSPVSRSSQIASDGSFRLQALSPAKYSVGTSDFGGDQSLTIRRVEQDGAIVNDNSVSIAQGVDHVNLRVVFEAGTGTIKGQVNVVGGAIPAGWRIIGSAQPKDRPGGQPRFIQVDARGRFTLNHLIGGDYEITVSVYPSDPQRTPPTALSTTRKTATVANKSEVNVTLVLDLSAPRSGGEPQ